MGVWTIGYGSTYDGQMAHVTAETPPVTEAEARALLARDLSGANHTVEAMVHTPLTPMEKAALADFIYNLGAGTFARSSVLSRLNAGDVAGALAAMVQYDHAGGKVLQGLLRRRQAEAAQFRT